MSEQTPPPRNLYEATESDSGKSTTGTVLTVDPLRQVATVLDARNGIHEDAPIMDGVGPDGEGWFGTPMPGWAATMSSELGMLAIHHLVPGATYFRDETSGPEKDDYTNEINTWLALTGTPKLYRTVEGAKKNFRSHRPSDLIAGDLGFRTAEGASVFALRGGVAGLKVSDLCQILLNSVDDLARLVTRNLDILSDWGTIQLVNEKGKTALKVRGNAKAENTYSDKFDFELSVGSGENFLDLKLLDKASEEPVYMVSVDQKGNQHIFLKKDQMIEIQGLQGIGITGSQKLIIGEDQSVEVDGDHELAVGGDSTETIDGTKTIKAPTVNLGGEDGHPVPFGDEVEAYLKSLVKFINTELILKTGVGPTAPGSTVPAPEVPDFNSKVSSTI